MSPTYCKQVGRWRVSKEVIGSGTTSTVHLASHTTIPTRCAAIKIVSRSGLLLKADGDPTALHLADAVIHREVLLMKLASHERIIKLYDFVERGDLVYMILEHAPNKTLFDLFRCYSSFLPTSLVTHLFSQLMHALEHLHSLHIVHRDIKLENVFLFGPDVKDVLQSDTTHAHSKKHMTFLPQSPRHRSTRDHNTSPPPYAALTLKLGDFGLSHTHSPTTLSTVFHGSPHYQAPELWARVPHHAFPTDVWSAGVVLFALVGRRLPFGVRELEEWGEVFNGNNCDEFHVGEKHEPVCENDAGKGHADRPPIPRAGTPFHIPYDALDTMPPAIDRLLQRLFALDPAMRPTAREVLDDASLNETSPVLQDSSHPENEHPAPPQHPHTDAYVPQDLYDLATLCTPPSTHVLRGTFRNSSLERRVRRRLQSKEECIERVWAGRLEAWAAWEGEEGVGAHEEKRVLDKDKGKENVVEKEKRVGWGDRKGWSKSLGRLRGADVLGHIASLGHLGHSGQRSHAEKAPQAAQREHGGHEETNHSVLKPKVGASLSFRSLRIKTQHKPSESKHARPAAYVPSPLASNVTPHNDAASALRTPPLSLKPNFTLRTLRIKASDRKHAQSAGNTPSSPSAHTTTRSALQSPTAQTLAFRQDSATTIRSRHDTALALQSRQDALLRRAHELGFGTHNLRVFADEAGRIVRDAKEGAAGRGYDGMNVVGEGDANVPTEGSSSTATTLVHENGVRGQKSSANTASADVHVANIVNLEVGGAERKLNVVDVDFTFDVDFGTDLHWM